MTNQTAPAFIGVDLARGQDETFTLQEEWPAPRQRTYIAGPMTGYPELNFAAFHAEAAALRSAGIDAVNPAEINADPNAGWLACMRADIAQLVTCDRIHMLPGWSKSKGATLEHTIAAALGLTITLAAGAEARPDPFALFASQFLNRHVQAADGASEAASHGTAAGTNVSHEAAISICERIADYHQVQLNAALPSHGYHNAVTDAHGYQYLGARRCVEALRIAARQTKA